MKKAISAFSKMTAALSKFAGIMLLVMSLLVCIHVILRAIFNAGWGGPGGIDGIYEMVQYGMLMIVSITLAENELTGGNIIVNFMLDKLKPRVANICSVCMYTLGTVGLAYILYNQIKMVFQKYSNGAITGVLKIPHWILVLVMCVGLFFFVIAFFIRTYNMVANHKNISNTKLTADEIAAALKATSEF